MIETTVFYGLKRVTQKWARDHISGFDSELRKAKKALAMSDCAAATTVVELKSGRALTFQCRKEEVTP